MCKIRTFFLSIIFVLWLGVQAYAANASLDGKTVSTSKGAEISGFNILIKLSGNEVGILKDKITISLDGAVWNNYKDSGWLSYGFSYEKLPDDRIKLIIDPDESMLKKGCTIKFPLNCICTSNQAAIKAVINWGIPEYADKELTFAKCSVTRAFLNGSIKQHNTGDKIYKRGSALSYNKLKINVVANDSERTRNKITVTLDGATWSDYQKTGTVANNRSASVSFKKLNEKTIQILLNDFNINMKNKGYELTLPLTGTITGSGEIKAIVDYGVEDIKPSEVVFARCVDGTLSITADDPNMPVDMCNMASSFTINDSTTQGYNQNTKIELALNQAYHFTVAPTLECSEKFDGKCKIELDKKNTQKCIITFTSKIESGTNGSIKVLNPVIERNQVNTPKIQAINITMNAKGWEKYTSSAQIAAFKQGIDVYHPALRVSAGVAKANKYFTNNIVFTDISTSGYKKDDYINLSLDNGFVYFKDGRLPNVGGTGKFKDKCEFVFDKDTGECRIAFISDISEGSTGKITLSNINFVKTTEGSFEEVNLTAGLSCDTQDRYSTIKIAVFSSFAVKTPDTTVTTTTTEATTESTTAAATETSSKDTTANNTVVIFKIGSQKYSINGNERELLAPPYIKDEYTMLPMRAVSNIVGISNENISYSNGTAEFVLDNENKLIVSVGKNEMSLADKTLSLSTPAEIINGTMFLPMRDLLNALGIDNDSISFESNTKQIILNVGGNAA